MLKFKIKSFRVYSPEKPKDNPLRAFADVCFNEAVTVCGVKLMEKDGFRIALPSYKRGEDYETMAYIEDAGLKEAVTATLVAMYAAASELGDA